MTIMEDVRSGKAGVYGVWMALLSFILLVVFSSSSFTSIWPFAIAGW